MTPARTGLFVSLALHGLIAGLLWWLWFKPAPMPKPPTALPISLSMFAPAPAQAPAPVQTPTVPQVLPEPAAPVEVAQMAGLHLFAHGQPQEQQCQGKAQVYRRAHQRTPAPPATGWTVTAVP